MLLDQQLIGSSGSTLYAWDNRTLQLLWTREIPANRADSTHSTKRPMGCFGAGLFWTPGPDWQIVGVAPATGFQQRRIAVGEPYYEQFVCTEGAMHLGLASKNIAQLRSLKFADASSSLLDFGPGRIARLLSLN